MYYRGSAAAVIVYDITKLVWIFISLEKRWQGWFLFKSIPITDLHKSNRYLIDLHFSLWPGSVLQDSFQTLKKWVEELKEHGPEDIVVAIAGNKNDLGDIRYEVSFVGLYHLDLQYNTQAPQFRMWCHSLQIKRRFKAWHKSSNIVTKVFPYWEIQEFEIRNVKWSQKWSVWTQV